MPALPSAAALRAAGAQAKLEVGTIDDPYEREADRIAAALVDGSDPPAESVPARAPGATIRRTCAACSEEEGGGGELPLLRKARPGAAQASPGAEAAVRGLGAGAPLPGAERAFFEPRLALDLTGVRFHTGAAADAAARSLGARAFTLGSDIAFAQGEYRPGSAAGRRLLAHELVHVAQQRQGDAGHAVQRQPRSRRRRGGAGPAPAAPDICERESRRVRGNFITRINIDLAAHRLRIVWHNATRIPMAGRGRPRISPGAGRCCDDCNDIRTSRASGTLCTPKGTWTVSRVGCVLAGHPTARNPTYFQRSGIAIHSGNTSNPPRSHGCVRTATSVSELIHDNVRPDVTTIVVSGTWSGLNCYMTEADQTPVSRARACPGPGRRPARPRTPPARPPAHRRRRAETEGGADRGLAEAAAPDIVPGPEEAAAAPAFAAAEAERGGDGPGPGNEPADEEGLPPADDGDDASPGALAEADEEEGGAETG